MTISFINFHILNKIKKFMKIAINFIVQKSTNDEKSPTKNTKRFKKLNKNHQ